LFAICIEASHSRGMGHLFRAINLSKLLKKKGEQYIVLINNDDDAIRILKENNICYDIVDLKDPISDWETKVILQYDITVWINDRLNTVKAHSLNVKKNNVLLVNFDDRGEGAKLSDINFVALSLRNNEKLEGKNIYTGIDYLILNEEIEHYRRIRTNIEHVVISMGGSDTHGVTIKIVEIYKRMNKKATIILGPSFRHNDLLNKMIDARFIVKRSVDSLLREFNNYDLAITGGGITPYEANASGLPCIIVANETFEISNGKYLAGLGSSIFAGFHNYINIDAFTMELDIEKMSSVGIEKIPLYGTENIYKRISEIHG